MMAAYETVDPPLQLTRQTMSIPIFTGTLGFLHWIRQFLQPPNIRRLHHGHLLHSALKGRRFRSFAIR